MQKTADRGIPPPARPDHKKTILGLKRGESWLFPLDRAPSVRNTVSQINGLTLRRYTTKAEDKGVRVWRIR